MNFLKNDKVALRVAEPYDAEIIYKWENDMDVWRDSETRVPFSMRQIEQFLLNNNDLVSEKQLRFIIEDTKNDNPVGCIDIYDYDSFNSRAGLGILIDEKYRGQGFAKSAIKLLLKYCFKTLLLNQIYILTLATNASSMKLFESIGFVKCGHKKQWYKTTHGFIDQIEYQYINKE